MQFRKKPVVIDAILYNGDNHQEVIDFTNGTAKYQAAVGGDEKGAGHPQLYTRLTIETLEGVYLCSVGDYVIKGVKGEYYPCKPDIFEMTYEKVENPIAGSNGLQVEADSDLNQVTAQGEINIGPPL
jgi:hypothetical protein